MQGDDQDQTGGCNALECSGHGGEPESQPRYRAADLEEAQASSPIGWNLSSSATIPILLQRCATSSACYVNPPDKAIVLSVDEKSQIQALDRTQPILPLRPALAETPNP